MQDNRRILLGGSSQVAISASVLSIGEVISFEFMVILQSFNKMFRLPFDLFKDYLMVYIRVNKETQRFILKLCK